ERKNFCEKRIFKKMKLRVRSKDKVHMINDLTPTSTIFELKSAIHALSGISPLRQELKIGYPPRVCGAKDDEILSSAGIQNGDQIILDENAFPEIISQPVSQPVDNVTGSLKAESISVPVENGFVVLREMEDDNSCLFRAIEDPETYSDVVLGRSRDDYCEWIAKKNSWGGAIELSIFASYYKVEIRSVDVKSGRIDRYDYDSVALTPMIGADQEYDQTVFDSSDEPILGAVMGVAEKMKQ
ncbi:27780_t:CDS:2, partial [Dentiscutata erythropus]